MGTHCHLDGIYCNASDLPSVALSHLKNVYFQTKQTQATPLCGSKEEPHSTVARLSSSDECKGIIIIDFELILCGENILLPRILVKNKLVYFGVWVATTIMQGGNYWLFQDQHIISKINL